MAKNAVAWSQCIAKSEYGGKFFMYSPLKHLAKSIWLNSYSPNNIMAMMTAYADASGKHNTDMVCVAGVVGYMRKWLKFEAEWNSVLKREGVSSFHATDFASSKGEYKSWKGDTVRRGKFFGDLINITRENVAMQPLSIGIEIEDWHAVNSEYMLAEKYRTPYSICGYAIVSECLRWSESRRKKTRIEFVFEDGEDQADESGLRSLCKQDGVIPIWRSKKDAVPCQAADLIAWKARIACLNARRLNSRMSPKNDEDDNWELYTQLLNEYQSLMKGIPTKKEPDVISQRNLIQICERDGIPRRVPDASPLT